MSDAENFLTRWSRRKAELAAQPEPPAPEETRAEGDSDPAVPATAAAEPEAEFDPSTLPPIESIDAGSDIRAFLAPGVPAEVTRAALRQVWAADPAIRDFVGLAENSWDFNAAGAVYGFDALKPAEIAELAKQFLQAQLPSPKAEPPPDSDPAQLPTQVADSGLRESAQQPQVALEAGAPHGEVMTDNAMVHRDTTGAEVPKEPAMRENLAQTPARGHGGALPR